MWWSLCVASSLQPPRLSKAPRPAMRKTMEAAATHIKSFSSGLTAAGSISSMRKPDGVVSKRVVRSYYLVA